jgi:hypothetical protein
MPAWKRRGCDRLPDANFRHSHSPLFGIGRNLESPLKFGAAFGCSHRGNYTSDEKESPARGRGISIETGHFNRSPSSRLTQGNDGRFRVLVQAEFEAAQRNNPKNWTQFRQQFEALKSMREIHDAPAERIPEDFARNAIARIYGIKPEDVTTEQIAFEVAGLLPAYPHIELIPSAPIPSAPIEAPKSAPETERSYVGIDNSRSSHPSPEPVPPPIAPGETIAAQLQRLRKECNWSADRLAEAVKFDPRTVTRHLSGETVPHLRNISAYERVFSKQLKRQVVINKMP